MENSRLAMRYEELAYRRRRLYQQEVRRRDADKRRRREARLHLMVACALPLSVLIIVFLAWLNWPEA
jgi:hypothetical protein